MRALRWRRASQPHRTRVLSRVAAGAHGRWGPRRRRRPAVKAVNVKHRRPTGLRGGLGCYATHHAVPDAASPALAGDVVVRGVARSAEWCVGCRRADVAGRVVVGDLTPSSNALEPDTCYRGGIVERAEPLAEGGGGRQGPRMSTTVRLRLLGATIVGARLSRSHKPAHAPNVGERIGCGNVASIHSSSCSERIRSRLLLA